MCFWDRYITRPSFSDPRSKLMIVPSEITTQDCSGSIPTWHLACRIGLLVLVFFGLGLFGAGCDSGGPTGGGDTEVNDVEYDGLGGSVTARVEEDSTSKASLETKETVSGRLDATFVYDTGRSDECESSDAEVVSEADTPIQYVLAPGNECEGDDFDGVELSFLPDVEASEAEITLSLISDAKVVETTSEMSDGGYTVIVSDQDAGEEDGNDDDAEGDGNGDEEDENGGTDEGNEDDDSGDENGGDDDTGEGGNQDDGDDDSEIGCVPEEIDGGSGFGELGVSLKICVDDSGATSVGTARIELYAKSISPGDLTVDYYFDWEKDDCDRSSTCRKKCSGEEEEKTFNVDVVGEDGNIFDSKSKSFTCSVN